MDKTPKYIKMCGKAEEIQKKWITITQQKDWDCSDFVYDKLNKNSYCLGGESGLVVRDFPKGYIWLSRQDQLQEMCGYKTNIHGGVYFIFSGFYYFLNPIDNGDDNWKEQEKYVQGFNTPEQLWLAFVMKEKFNKVWDNEKEEWIKDERR